MPAYKSVAKIRNGVRDFFLRNRYHYQATFDSVSGDHVLKDLSKFARLNDDLFRDDPRTTDYLCGQRSVVLRIVRIMKMTDEEIANLTQDKDNIL